jgi:hypothetical protein
LPVTLVRRLLSEHAIGIARPLVRSLLVWVSHDHRR